MTSGQQDDRDRGRTGVAPIKAEYLLATPQGPSKSERPGPADDDAAEGRGEGDGGEGKKNNKKKGGWKTRTQGKAAGSERTGERGFRLCRQFEQTGKCELNKCKFSHSWDEYFKVKPLDIHREGKSALSDTPPHVSVGAAQVGGDDVVGKSIDLSTECPVYKELGYCPAGWRCRFLGGHVRKATEESADSTSPTRIGQWELLGRREHTEDREGLDDEVNWPKGPVLHSLRKDTYEWDFTPKYLGKVEPHKPFSLKRPDLGTRKDAWKKKKVEVNEEEAMNAPSAEEAATNVADEEDAMNGVVDGESEAIDVPLRPEEKRRLNWDNGLYLAPLTTVGNLPFRRVCVDYGATITISEMALAQPLVTGQNEEWALMRRHKSEKMFGVQLAGGWPNRMVPTAEMLARELGPSGIDFVDVNMGCPIDLVFNQGAGSALMDNSGRLEKILVGMNRALGEIPLTVKFRTGVAHGKPNAHKLIPRFATEWGASAMTIHGRSRQQRYSKLADWKYIKQCVDTLREATEEANMAPVPIFGNGDCYSAQSYYEEKEASGVDGVMLARGALIKPWLFTEIAERREWDISATERLEGIRKFAEYGLSHWGSDTLGVNTTRRFLCEALSFQCRYVPIGLLERMPPMLNERPPPYHGRNELETLLSSPYVGDWVKISEMFLGPAGDDFRFVPKHKSNAYGNEEANG